MNERFDYLHTKYLDGMYLSKIEKEELTKHINKWVRK